MRSDTWTVRQAFQDRRQFMVPFYQRAYVWRLDKQWELLWSDIRLKAEERLAGITPTPHFLGAIVLEPQERQGLRGVDTLHIIDGQQRLTTLQYVLTAVLIALKESGVSGFDSTVEECLQNGNADTMLRPEVEKHKVWPTFSDRAHYERTMRARSLSELQCAYPESFTQAGSFRKISVVHPRSLEAVWAFANWLSEWIKDNGGAMAGEMLVTAILHDLKFVIIELEKTDDAQIIFETMNGRGAELHATDLIRNHLFMRADRDGVDSQQLYDTMWKQFEDSKWSVGERRGRMTRPRLEWLIYTALRSETGKEGDLPRLYTDFKAYGANGGQVKTAQEQLQMLDMYGEHYLGLTTGNGSIPVARFGRRIQAYDTTTSHPLALRISTACIPDAEKTAMFNTMMSYLVRRAVCNLTPKNYNNVFMSALRHLGKTGITNEALIGFFSSQMGEISRWPKDAEFINACVNAPLYWGRLDSTKARAFLTEIEGFLRSGQRSEEPDLPNLSSLDIDHILPRVWYTHWPLADGVRVSAADAQSAIEVERQGLALTPQQSEIRRREKAVMTLGNLTLLNLSVNREAQNKDFTVKRELLIKNTNLSLNVPLVARSSWDDASIIERSSMLANAAAKLYPRPE